MLTLLCRLNLFTVFSRSKWFASILLTTYVRIPIFAVIYLAHRAVFRYDRWVWGPQEVDMQTRLEEVMECEKPLEKSKWWKRISWLSSRN
jgi:amino acid transporter